ncbi:hypothetical protein THITE_2118139 [Paecilomyces variotii No. 5]|uniref:Xylanolytic transcriptional activator regulatory domain-containing protein n=1 Tax=Byssochlamys spectabilis (strain No. 5 / NBRC 109023) TaxID=1356009 RepID=V5I688_BYSSN|nr:hypothetical protein THITE_2118139 [Paecilomyces variotii No. 5]
MVTRRIKALEEELKRMRRQLHEPKVQTDTRTATSFSHLSPAEKIPVADKAVVGDQADACLLTNQSLEDVTLQPEDILSLIKRLSPAVPILTDLSNFLAGYDSNKLLLWKTLAIVSKESDQHSTLYPSLVDPVRRLAGDLYGPQSRDFETIQALLLLCVWPFPFQQSVSDPTPIYCGLSTQLAYQTGLQRPNCRMHWKYDVISSSSRIELERRKVWFGCFVVNQHQLE